MAKKVYVLGELNVDLIVTASDVMPEFNKEKLVDTFDLVQGSSSAITACGLAGLGLDVTFVSVIGSDVFGKFAVSELHRHGVDTRFVHMDKALKTGVSLSLSTEKDRALLTFLGSIPCLVPEHLPQEMYEQADHIHFGSYFLQERMRTFWEEIFRNAKERGITTSFDTGWDPNGNWHKAEICSLLKHTDMFLPSEDEFLRIFGAKELEQALDALPEERGWIAVKRGAQGSVLIRLQGEIIEKVAFSVIPVDTTGSGDSFDAGFIYGFLHGFNDKMLLEFANACGALATQRIGGASWVPSVTEVREFIMKAADGTYSINKYT